MPAARQGMGPPGSRRAASWALSVARPRVELTRMIASGILGQKAPLRFSAGIGRSGGCQCRVCSQEFRDKPIGLLVELEKHHSDAVSVAMDDQRRQPDRVTLVCLHDSCPHVDTAAVPTPHRGLDEQAACGNIQRNAVPIGAILEVQCDGNRDLEPRVPSVLNHRCYLRGSLPLLHAPCLRKGPPATLRASQRHRLGGPIVGCAYEPLPGAYPPRPRPVASPGRSRCAPLRS